jgi:hypothetical protein
MEHCGLKLLCQVKATNPLKDKAEEEEEEQNFNVKFLTEKDLCYSTPYIWQTVHQ